MTLETRIKHLERMFAKMKRRQMAFYQTCYAHSRRRLKGYRAHDTQIKRWVNRFDKLGRGNLGRLGRILSGLETGRRLVLLPNQEYQLLRFILRRRSVFGPKHRSRAVEDAGGARRL